MTVFITVACVLVATYIIIGFGGLILMLWRKFVRYVRTFNTSKKTYPIENTWTTTSGSPYSQID